jgi:hypothetical protein
MDSDMELKLSLRTLPRLPLEQKQLADDCFGLPRSILAQKCFHLSSKDGGVLKGLHVEIR